MSILQTNSIYFDSGSVNGVNFSNNSVTITANGIATNTQSLVSAASSSQYNSTGTYLLSANSTAPAGYISVSNTPYNSVDYPNLSTIVSSSNSWVSNPFSSGTVPNPSVYGANCIVYGNGVFVATIIGGNSLYLRSTDGITWTQSAVYPVGYSGTAIAYGNGKFVYSDVGLNVYNSTDAITWSNATSSAYTAAGITLGTGNTGQVYIVNNTFVVSSYLNGTTSGSSANTIKSTDGTTWSSAYTIPFTISNSWVYGALMYGNGVYVCASANSVGRPSISTSTDLITWTTRTGAFDGDYAYIANNNTHYTGDYGNGTFVLDASLYYSRGWVQTSTDGVNWTARQTANSYTGISTIKFVNGRFFALGAQSIGGLGPSYGGGGMSSTQTSTDGITWTNISSSILTKACGVVSSGSGYGGLGSWGALNISYGNNVYVVVGGSSQGLGNTIYSKVIPYNSNTQFITPPFLEEYYGTARGIPVYDTATANYGNTYIYIKT